MDTYVILSKYTSEGWKYAGPDDARKRWEVIAASLQKTLNGKVLAHYVCMGGTIRWLSLPSHRVRIFTFSNA